MWERKKVLITVKTYPQPSAKYLELVCTAGMLEDGSFIRLYPIDYRYLPFEKWYGKYQWIEVEVEKNPKDPRKESFRPNVESISTLGDPLSPARGWAERKTIVLKQPPKSIEQLDELRKTDGVSLGLVRPKRISDFIVEPATEDWKPEQLEEMKQLTLLGPERKPLAKIPFKFSYRFDCDDERCTGHQMMIEDWEVGQLYLREVAKLGDADKAVESVKKKFFGQLCAKSVDTHFFVGTVMKFGSWIVLGVFWPPKQEERTANQDLLPGF